MLETVESINKIIDVTEEDDPPLSEKLTELSKKHNAVLMACIAPYVGLKVSPTKTVNAQMGLCDEFAVETAINQIQTKTDAKKTAASNQQPRRTGSVFLQNRSGAA